MRSRIWALAFFFFGLFFVVGGAGVLGYYGHKWQLSPLYDLAERVEKKGRRVLGLPTETATIVDRVDTTFVRLRGQSYVMPDNDFANGGALAVWGKDVLVMHKSGTVLYLDDAQGLVVSGIDPPDNGLAAYMSLAQTRYADLTHDFQRVRFNDIEFIDAGDLRGLLVSYTYVDTANDCYRSRLSWLALSPDVVSIREARADADDWDLVFETGPCLAFNPTGPAIVGYMAGGRMAFRPPETLYLAVGEYHRDGIYRPDAGIQDDLSDYGKTIAIDLRTRERTLFSKGHRNLQGVAVDGGGRLWVTEHGMRGGDELNLVIEGGNYGWPLENLGTLYSGVPAPTVSGPGRHDAPEYRPPVYAWLPSAAVSSLAYVDGFHEAWDGDLLIGSLKGRTLFRARIADDRVVFLEDIKIGQRIRDVMQVDADRLALWLDTNELVVFRIEPRRDPLEGLEAALTQNMDADLAAEVVATLNGCGECHSYEKDIHQVGPSLYGIVDRPVASTGFSGYSDALISLSGAWAPDRLNAYLLDPGGLAPGTGMAGMMVSDETLRAAVVAGLETLSRRQAQEDRDD